MRRNGVLGTVGELGPSDHACWLYQDDDEFRSEAARFLEDGVRLGQRLLYVGGRGVGELREDLASLPRRDELIGADALRLASLSEHYQRPSQIAPEQQLQQFIDITHEAIADGYRGLRLVAEVSELVGDPADRPARAHTEHLAERFMAAGNPMAALCCYDWRRLGWEGLEDIACVHPLVRAPHAERVFRLFGNGDKLALAGEVDTFNAPTLERALANTQSATIDLGALDFIDHAGLLVLTRHRRQVLSAGGELEFVAIPPLARRTLELLGDSLDGPAGSERDGV
jgi:anti-anti-sigma factor